MSSLGATWPLTSYFSVLLCCSFVCFTMILLTFVVFKVSNKSNFRGRHINRDLKSGNFFTLKSGGWLIHPKIGYMSKTRCEIQFSFFNFFPFRPPSLVQWTLSVRGLDTCWFLVILLLCRSCTHYKLASWLIIK